MKAIFISMFLIIPLVGFSQNSFRSGQVNAVLGDTSYMEMFEISPTEETNYHTRIVTHLKYVKQRLSEADVSHLSNEQKQSRQEMIGLLHAYTLTGVFPSNYNFPGETRPCFIDKDDRICAVGYLVQQTAGDDVARTINSNHKYEYLLEMESE